jgi:hypothetical protein
MSDREWLCEREGRRLFSGKWCDHRECGWVMVKGVKDCPACLGTGGVRVPCMKCKNGEPEHDHKCEVCGGTGERRREYWEGLAGLLHFCTTHMAPRVWTGEDNCVYRASWKASYPDPCNFEWMRFSFDVEPARVAEWINRRSGNTSLNRDVQSDSEVFE